MSERAEGKMELRERVAQALYDDRPTAGHDSWSWERLRPHSRIRREWEAKADVVITVFAEWVREQMGSAWKPAANVAFEYVAAAATIDHDGQPI